MSRKIVTHHVFPPIPDRSYDWCAYYDGEEERREYGWGATEQEALEDFHRLQAEMAEAEDLADLAELDDDWLSESERLGEGRGPRWGA